MHLYIIAVTQAHIIFNVTKGKRLFGINLVFAATMMKLLLWFSCTCTKAIDRICDASNGSTQTYV